MQKTTEHKPPRKPRDVLLDTYYMLIPLISINMYWFLLTLPLVTAPAALMALFATANQMTKGDSVGWGEFWEAFRSYFWTGWRWVLLDGLILGILSLNVWFYRTNFNAEWAYLVDGLMVGFTILWVIVQCFVPAVLTMQEKKSIRMALRNSAGLIAYRPLVMAPAALGTLALCAVSTFYLPPVWIFITGSLSAYFISLATRKTLERLLEKQKLENPPENPTPPAG
jgi:uncharacterized membrane protein YesL